MGGSLSGVRVLCFEHAWAGPYASMMLADLGADVVKVESPDGGDHVRRWSRTDLGGQSPHFLSVNRNKRSVVLDLKTDAGRRTAHELVAVSDVLLENFRPGVTRRLGLDHASLAQRHPGLVYASVSGYGQSGPYAARPAYDLLVQAESGLLSVTGGLDGTPAKVGIPVIDVMSAMVAAFGIVAALRERERSGTGRHVDVSMLEVAASAMSFNVVDTTLTGHVATPMGTAHPLLAPYQVYETSTDPIALGVLSDRHWQAFCVLLERPEWIDDSRFATAPERVGHRAALNALLEPLLLQRTSAEWEEALHGLGLPCAVVRSVAQLGTHPQLAHRDFMRTQTTGTGTPYTVPGAPWGSVDGEPPARPPELGEHTDEVLAEWLGGAPC